MPCDVFVTEATFALPIYRWDPIDQVMDQLMRWWQANEAAGKASVIFCYALGKAQRLLAEIGRRSTRPIYVHGAIDALLPAYRDAGISLAETLPVLDQPKEKDFAGDAGDRAAFRFRFALDAAYGRLWHSVCLRLDACARASPPPRFR